MSGRTDWADGFIAVDWGTTNRRAYLVEKDGGHTDEFEDARGILAVGRGRFEAAVEEIRHRLGDRPMLLAGMIGSNRGWVEAPYVQCPAGIDELAVALVHPDGRTSIVPGLSYRNGRADVMRGEEVQVLGAVTSHAIPQHCVVCHPGTHNKWIRVAKGRIESFLTVMTGELFNLLKDHSILSDLLGGETEPGGAFSEGVCRSLSGAGIAAELFGARAGYLLGRLDKEESTSFVSGVLIGEDVRVGLSETREGGIVVMGRPALTRLYSAALEIAGAESVQVDGEGAFIAGARAIVERMQ